MLIVEAKIQIYLFLCFDLFLSNLKKLFQKIWYRYLEKGMENAMVPKLTYFDFDFDFDFNLYLFFII